MIHQAGYVKVLIKKYIEGSITGVELERLKACWKIYEEEELLNMTAEVLYTAGKQEPGDALKGWEPDFAKIISDTQRIRGNKKRLLCGKMAGAACLLLLLVMAVNYFIFRKWPGSYATNGCEDMPSRGEIPKSEFACTVRWGDTTVLTVDSSATGLVTQISNFDIRQEAPGVLAVTILSGTTPAPPIMQAMPEQGRLEFILEPTIPASGDRMAAMRPGFTATKLARLAASAS